MFNYAKPRLLIVIILCTKMWSDVSQLEFSQQIDCSDADIQIKFVTGKYQVQTAHYN